MYFSESSTTGIITIFVPLVSPVGSESSLGSSATDERSTLRCCGGLERPERLFVFFLTLLLLTLLLPLNARSLCGDSSCTTFLGAERESRAGGDVCLEMPPLTLPLAFPIACADVEEEEDVEEDKLGCGGGGTTEALSRS